MNECFHKYASRVAELVGTSWAFLTALAVVMTWALTGPLFHFSDTWQLVINTGTTIITFLMVFLIQNTQNRDAKAIHLKLDELIRANAEARNHLIDLENLSDAELEKLHAQFRALATVVASAADSESADSGAAEQRSVAAVPQAAADSGSLSRPSWIDNAVSAVAHERKKRSARRHRHSS